MKHKNTPSAKAIAFVSLCALMVSAGPLTLAQVTKTDASLYTFIKKNRENAQQRPADLKNGYKERFNNKIIQECGHLHGDYRRSCAEEVLKEEAPLALQKFYARIALECEGYDEDDRRACGAAIRKIMQDEGILPKPRRTLRNLFSIVPESQHESLRFDISQCRKKDKWSDVRDCLEQVSERYNP